MKVTGIGTVFMRVRHLEQSVRFYSDILKLDLQGIEDQNSIRMAHFAIHMGSPLLTLIEDDTPPKLENPIFNLNGENILEWYDEITSKGVRVGSINRWSSEWNDHIDFDVYDPDGNPINIVERKNRVIL